MIVAYKTDWITYNIVKYLVKTNILCTEFISGRAVGVELIQHKAKPDKIANALLN